MAKAALVTLSKVINNCRKLNQMGRIVAEIGARTHVEEKNDCLCTVFRIGFGRLNQRRDGHSLSEKCRHMAGISTSVYVPNDMGTYFATIEAVMRKRERCFASYHSASGTAKSSSKKSREAIPMSGRGQASHINDNDEENDVIPDELRDSSILPTSIARRKMISDSSKLLDSIDQSTKTDGSASVRVVFSDKNEIMSVKEAQKMAREKGLDLIVVSKDSSPPVYKLVRLTLHYSFKSYLCLLPSSRLSISKE